MLLAIPLLLCSLAITVSAQGGRDSARVLLFSATAAFRHDSIPTAIRALQANAQSINVTFDSTEDGSLFTTENLDRYDAVVFLSNTGEGVLLERRFDKHTAHWNVVELQYSMIRARRRFKPI